MMVEARIKSIHASLGGLVDLHLRLREMRLGIGGSGLGFMALCYMSFVAFAKRCTIHCYYCFLGV